MSVAVGVDVGMLVVVEVGEEVSVTVGECVEDNVPVGDGVDV